MIIDFQQHYTPAEMLKGDPRSLTAQVDERGNPNYLLNPQLGDLNNHVRMMDHAGIDMGVLSCGVGFDQPDLKICRAINDRMAQAEKDHPGPLHRARPCAGAEARRGARPSSSAARSISAFPAW